ncbi:MAG: tRNA 4-thiouridine(8) synthase ThiI [Thermoplasmatales archaeon B_DKE]|nr:MAG: tRNA 4-thiouridine(8) synthase ThiI [Thermoplasmatales archaeon B_DKE]
MFIVRYSEIGLKGRKARSSMERLLLSNLLLSLKKHGISADARRESGRIMVYPVREGEEAENAIGYVAGVKSFSPCTEHSASTLDEVVEVARSEFSQAVKGKTFAVRSRRTGSHDFTSMDMDRAIGSAIFEGSAGVDLRNPQVEVGVEIRDSELFLYSRVIKGPGGLPLGSQGKLVGLMSSGIDSPVAAWMMMKRGSPVDLIFCSLAHPVDTLAFLKSAEKLLGKWSTGVDATINIIDGRPLIEAFADKNRYHFQNVEFKRALYLIAQVIAIEEGAHGIVTGESLGQVSSQTAENLGSISHGLEIPIFRPLIGFDKDQIIDLARQIGTMPEADLGEFCSLFADTPITRITTETLDRDMGDFALADQLASQRVSFKFSELDRYLESLSGGVTGVNGIEANSVVLDMRSADKYQGWHYPGAIRAGLGDITDIVDKLGKDKVYIVYCQKGLQSAYAASRIKSLGANAFYANEESMRKISGVSLS